MSYDNKASDASILGLNDVSLSVPLTAKTKRVLVDKINYSLPINSRLAILGPNGSGKSTFLRMVLGDKRFYEGNVERCFGEFEVGYMPQNYRQALFPWLNLSQNLELYNSMSDNVYFDTFCYYLNLLNLSFTLKSRVGSLSGGEQQLILLSMLLSKNNKLLILDEPFSAVDLYRKKKVRNLLSKYFKELSTNIIIVTHDVEDAVSLSQEAIILSGNPSNVSYIKNNCEDEYRAAIYGKFY